MTEAQLTAAILDALHARGVLAMRNAQRGRTYRTGLGPGSADIIGIVRSTVTPDQDGRFLALEVKLPKGKIAEEQLAWCRAVNARGGYATFVRSVEEAMRAVDAAARGDMAA